MSQTAAESLNTANVVNVPLASIAIGLRRRKVLGDLRALRHSIETRGLIHPIVVHGENELVCGHRRVEVCRALGWKMIPARRISKLTPEILRALESDENAHRLGLSPFEQSKARLAEIRQAEADLKASYLRSDSEHKLVRKRGRPNKAGSKRQVASVTGISPASQIEVERHVSLAEQYPALQRDGWKQSQVLAAGEALEKLPEGERPKAAVLIDQDAIPAKKAVAILEHLSDLPAKDRAAIYQKAEADDPHIRERALTDAAGLPPTPDPALNHLREARDAAKRAEKVCRDDQFIEEVRRLSSLASALVDQFTKHVRRTNGVAA